MSADRVDENDVEAVLDCLRGGWLTMGPRVQTFEQRFADYLGVDHAVAVSSGTAALHLALLAAGIGPGDEVIVPDFAFVAAAASPIYCGASPVLCDSRGPHDLNPDPDDVLERITPRTRAVIAVHGLGYAADVETLRTLCGERDVKLIEDAAQAVGARTPSGQLTGTVGDAGCFSFSSGAQLSAGEGGIVVSSDAELAAKVRLLRSHGMTSGTWDRHLGHTDNYDVVEIGFNYRLDEAHAALALSRLGRLDEDVAIRRARVRRYREALASSPAIEIPWREDEVCRSSHFAFAVLLEDARARDRARAGLAERGVQTAVSPALGELGYYRARGRAVAGALARAREASLHAPALIGHERARRRHRHRRSGGGHPRRW